MGSVLLCFIRYLNDLFCFFISVCVEAILGRDVLESSFSTRCWQLIKGYLMIYLSAERTLPLMSFFTTLVIAF